MPALNNHEFEKFPHDPDIVDKLAWRSDLKVKLPTPIFSADLFTAQLLRKAATGVRIAECWTVPDSELLVAKFIYDVPEEGHEAAIQKAVHLTLGGIAITSEIPIRELSFKEFGLTWMYEQQMFGAEPENVLPEAEALRKEIALVAA